MLGAGLAGGAGPARRLHRPRDTAPRATPAPAAPTSGATTGLAGPGDLTVPDFDPRRLGVGARPVPARPPTCAQFAAFVLSPHTAQV